MEPTLVHQISFHGDGLQGIEKDGVFYIVMKPMCEGMGLDWESQRQLIQRDSVLDSVACKIQVTGSDGKTYEMLCLPLDYIPGWLFKLDENRYEGKKRELIHRYRKECYQVLADYWLNLKQNKTPAEAWLNDPTVKEYFSNLISNNPVIQDMRFKIDGLQSQFGDFALKIERMDGNVIYLVEIGPRVDLSKADERTQYLFIDSPAYQNRCPICLEPFKKGDPLRKPEIDHFFRRSEANLKSTWVICKEDNIRKRNGEIAENTLDICFRHYQLRLEVFLKQKRIKPKPKRKRQKQELLPNPNQLTMF